MLHRILALALGIVGVLFFLGWQAFSLWGLKNGSFLDESSLRLVSAGQRETAMGLEQIATLHLFGNAASAPVAPPLPAELPKTDLKLLLVGAITDSKPEKASALIQAENQTRRYYIGDSIPGGAVLHEVLADSIVLKRDSRYETLGFPKGGDITPQARSALAAISASAPQASPGQGNVANTAETAPQRNAQPARTAPPDRGLSLRERLQRTPRTPQQAPPRQ